MVKNVPQQQFNRAAYVKLADAYQRLGKADYGNVWEDHEICIVSGGKYHLTNLTPYLQPINHQSPEPQLYPINLATDDKLVFSDAPPDKVQVHKRISGLLCKFIGGGAIKIDATTIDGKHYDLPYHLWQDETGNVVISFVESRITFYDGKAKIICKILVEPESLKNWVNDFETQRIESEKRQRRSAADMTRGRKSIYDWDKFREMAKQITAENPMPSKPERAKILVERMQKAGIKKIPDIDSLRKIF